MAHTHRPKVFKFKCGSKVRVKHSVIDEHARKISTKVGTIVGYVNARNVNEYRVTFPGMEQSYSFPEHQLVAYVAKTVVPKDSEELAS